MPLQSLMQIQPMTKSLDQEQSAIVSKTIRLEGKLQCLQTFFHSPKVSKPPRGPLAITSLPVSLLPEPKKQESINVSNASRRFKHRLYAFLRLNVKCFYSDTFPVPIPCIFCLLQLRTGSPLDDSLGDGVAGQAGNFVDLQFVHHLLAMFFYGFDADAQFGGNLLVGQAFGH